MKILIALQQVPARDSSVRSRTNARGAWFEEQNLSLRQERTHFRRVRFITEPVNPQTRPQANCTAAYIFGSRCLPVAVVAARLDIIRREHG